MSVYNEEEWVSKAIDSMLKQTYKNFEFIIVNDGSKDGTLAILNKYAKKDKRIKVINQTNTGLTIALNNGLAKCSGDYIARMDADNLSAPKRLEKQVKFLESHKDYALVGSWREDVFLDSKRILKLPTSNDDIKKGLVRTCMISHSSVLIRTKIMKKYKYDPKFRTSQDYDLWVRIAKKYKLANLPEVLTLAYYRSNSITRTKSLIKALNFGINIRFKAYIGLKVPFWYIVFIGMPFFELFLPKKLIKWYVDWRMRK